MRIVEGSVGTANGHSRPRPHDPGDPGGPGQPADQTSLDLSARAAELAVRVAGLVEENCSPGSAQAAVDFLRSWARQSVPDVVSPMPAAPFPSEPATAAMAPLDRLCARYPYGPLDLDLILLAGLPEEHEGLAATFRALHPSGEPRPTLGLAALLAGGGPASRTRVRRLCLPGGVIGDDLVRLTGDRPLFERSIELAPAIWDALRGGDAWPTGLARVRPGTPPPGLDDWLRLPAARQAIAALAGTAARTLVCASEDEAIALSRCAALAVAAGTELAGGRIQAHDTAGTKLIAAHAALRGAVPVICVSPAGPDAPSSPAVLDLSPVPGPVLVCTRPGAVLPDSSRPLLTVPVGPIHAAGHRRAWERSVPHLAGSSVTLATRHPLDPALTAVVATDLLSSRQLGGTAELSDVAAAIRGRAVVSLPAGVSLTTPDVTWDQLILPAEQSTQLRDAVLRLDHQRTVLEDWGFGAHPGGARGVRLLFTGPPGTGKSLAAAAMAHSAGTDLLMVDVARLVSKWIGETEKNLAGAFEVAERTRAVLLLDEADVLFGARTQISDANDRYANLETAYLLQRMDTFDGLIVLTTNLRHNIDAAFMRRLDFLIEFGLPDETDRARLWDLHLGEKSPLAADVDLRALARVYPVPGAWIRNAAIGAAFLAAPSGGPITRAHVLRAIRREYAKASRPCPGEPPKTVPEQGRAAAPEGWEDRT
jgi:hypothetical protein